MDYIRIIDWDKFQHYKKRNPPWIKLHVSLLDNDAFECLHNDSKVLLICLYLFAARKGNGDIPANVEYLQRKLPLGKKIKLQPLMDAGFIECYQDDSKMIAKCPIQNRKYLCAETETETETETEKNVKKNEYMEFVYLTDDEHSKLIEQFGDAGLEERIARLNNYIGSKGIKYKSHYHTILSWERKNDRNNRQTVTSGPGQSGPRPAKPWTDRSFTAPPEEGSYRA